MINMSAKFDKETRNGVVSIVFTMRDYQESVTIGQTDTRTHTQTDAGQSDPYVPLFFAVGFILASWLTCLPSLTKKHATV